MNKKDIETKKSLARTLFMNGMEQVEIADKVSVSKVTVCKWAVAESWKEQRAATHITRPELINKILTSIDHLIDQVNASNDPNLIAGLGDKLAKFSSTISKLDKKANVVDVVDVSMAFSKWLEFRAQTDSDITIDIMKKINHYQDMFIVEKINNK